MLNVDNLTFSYSRRKYPVIRNLSLDIESGKVYGLMGKNGAGKTTLLYLMAGVLTPSAGEVKYEGIKTRKRLPSTLDDIFIIPEEVNMPSISLYDYVRVNAPFYPRFSHDEMIKNIDLLNIDKDIKLGGLSMGQKKKVMMSFALACNTSLLLMDEPTNGIDIPGKEALRRLITLSMNDERSIVISTHQARDVEGMLDNVIIMDESRVIMNQSIAEIAEKLKFVVTDDDVTINKALYSLPTVYGCKAVLLNRNGEETEPDLEMLFNLVVSNPGVIDSIFRNK